MPYSFTVTCPRCGGTVDHVTSGRSTEGGTRANAVCKCVECKWSWLLTVTMRTLSGTELEGAA